MISSVDLCLHDNVTDQERLLHHHFLSRVPGLPFRGEGWNLDSTSAHLGRHLTMLSGSLSPLVSQTTRDTLARLGERLFESIIDDTEIELPPDFEPLLVQLELANHAARLLFQRQENDKYTVLIFSTGAGHENHFRDAAGKVLAYWGFTDVPPISASAFSGDWLQEVKRVDSVQELYDRVAIICQQGAPLQAPESPLHFQRPQVRGVCAAAVNKAVLRYMVLWQTGDVDSNYLQYKVVKSLLDASIWEADFSGAADVEALGPPLLSLASQRVAKTWGDRCLAGIAADPARAQEAIRELSESLGEKLGEDFSTTGERFVALRAATGRLVMLWVLGVRRPSKDEMSSQALLPAVCSAYYRVCVMSTMRDVVERQLSLDLLGTTVRYGYHSLWGQFQTVYDVVFYGAFASVAETIQNPFQEHFEIPEPPSLDPEGGGGLVDVGTLDGCHVDIQSEAESYSMSLFERGGINNEAANLLAIDIEVVRWAELDRHPGILQHPGSGIGQLFHHPLGLIGHKEERQK
jgi:hypothetical protein